MTLGIEKTTDRPSSRTLREQNDISTGAAMDEDSEWPREWAAYTSLMGNFFLMFNSWGLINAFGTFLSIYQEFLLPNNDILQLNLIGSTQCFMVLGLSFVVGRLLDADHSRYLVVAGTCFVAIGMFTLSAVNGDGQSKGNYVLTWLVQGPITGLGMACFFVTSSQVAATWFPKKKGFAISIVACGASISGLVYPIMLRFIYRSNNFNFAVQMVAIVIVSTCILAACCARPNPKHQHNKPSKWLRVETWVDTTACRDAVFLWFTLSICCLFLGFYAVFFNLEEWAAKEGVGFKGGFNPNPGTKALQTYYLLAIMNGTSTIGRLGSAFLCVKFNPLHVHCAVTLVSSLLCFFLWTFATTLPVALAFVVLFGAFSGSVIGLPPASMASILHTNGEKLGQWVGMMYTASSPFALTGPVIAGHLISTYGYNYVTVQCWSGSCLLLSSFCMAVAMFYDGRAKDRIIQEKNEGPGTGTDLCTPSFDV